MANSIKAEGVIVVSHVATVSSEGSVRHGIHGQFRLFYSKYRLIGAGKLKIK